MINAVILAGDRCNFNPEGPGSKALIKIKGKAMVEYVVRALRESKQVGQIAVVGPVKQLKLCLKDEVDHFIEGEDSLLENALKGLKLFQDEHRVLLLTSDIPMLTAQALDHFITQCDDTGADLCYPIVRKEDNQAKFPTAKRTYARLKEGTFTGGNILYVNPRAVDRCISFAKQMIEYRKKPWKMCRVLGWNFVFGLLVGSLTIPGIEERISRLLDMKVAAILSPYPEISNDVDKESDLAVAREHLENIS